MHAAMQNYHAYNTYTRLTGQNYHVYEYMLKFSEIYDRQGGGANWAPRPLARYLIEESKTVTATIKNS